MNFGQNGFTEAILQRDQIDHFLASNLFWINVGFGLLLTIGFAACGSLLARFYGEPRLTLITLGLSATIFLNSTSVVHLALLKRAMNFHTTAVNDILARTATVGVSILLAWRVIRLGIPRHGLSCGPHSRWQGSDPTAVRARVARSRPDLHLLRPWHWHHAGLLLERLDSPFHRKARPLAPLGVRGGRRDGIAVRLGTALGACGDSHSLDGLFLDSGPPCVLVCRQAHTIWYYPHSRGSLEVRSGILGGGFRFCPDH